MFEKSKESIVLLIVRSPLYDGNPIVIFGFDKLSFILLHLLNPIFQNLFYKYLIR